MAAFARLDGEWRGAATMTAPDGRKVTTTHTERVGPLLDGTGRLIEGRSYDQSGRTAFNALGVASYDPDTRRYQLRSHAMGRSGEFPLTPTAGGSEWEMKAGRATIRYVATIRDGQWIETGERIEPGKPPLRFIEMKLARIGDSEWPAGGAVPPR